MDSVVNVEETIGKTVGNRRPPSGLNTQFTPDDARAWRKAFNTPFIPRGVYRFASHEEADAWLMRMLTRKRPNRNHGSPPSATSPNSVQN
jgi:hypothetical protein